MKLFYRTFGNGETITVVHGLFGMSDNWLSFAKKMAIHFKVHLLDMRNHGNSPHDKRHTYRAMSSDIANFLNEHKIDKTVLVGHSMGGKACLEFARHFPEKVAKLIIVDISPSAYPFYAASSDKNFFHRHFLKTLMKIDLNGFANRRELSVYIKEQLKDNFFIQTALKNIKKQDKGYGWKINIPVLYENLDELRKEISPNKALQETNMLFVFGANSPYYTDVEKRYIQEKLPRAIIKVIPDCGHLLHIEQEQYFIDTILPFIMNAKW